MTLFHQIFLAKVGQINYRSVSLYQKTLRGVKMVIIVQVEAYLKACQTSNLERLAKIVHVNDFRKMLHLRYLTTCYSKSWNLILRKVDCCLYLCTKYQDLNSFYWDFKVDRYFHTTSFPTFINLTCTVKVQR